MAPAPTMTIGRGCEGRGQAADTIIGSIPTPGSLDRNGLDLRDEALARLLKVDAAEWAAAVPSQEQFFATFGNRLPPEIRAETEALARRTQDAAAKA